MTNFFVAPDLPPSPQLLASPRASQTLLKNLSQAYQTQADAAKKDHEQAHGKKPNRLTKFKEKLTHPEKEEKALSWLRDEIHAQPGNNEQENLMDSYNTLVNIEKAEGNKKFYRAAELEKSGIALQKQYLVELGITNPSNEFFEKTDTEKMERRVDELEELAKGQNQNQSPENKSFSFYELIKDTSNASILNSGNQPQPTKKDKNNATAALKNYLIIKALDNLEADYFKDINTLTQIAFFLRDTALLAQNTSLPTCLDTLRNNLKIEAEKFLSTAKAEAEAEAEAEAKQSTPEVTARQNALKLQLALMTITYYSRDADTQSEIKYYTKNIEPAMKEASSLTVANGLDYWLDSLSNGNFPEAYSHINEPDRKEESAFYRLITIEKKQKRLADALENQKSLQKELEEANEKVTTTESKHTSLQKELKKAQKAQQDLQKKLEQAEAKAETERKETKTAGTQTAKTKKKEHEQAQLDQANKGAKAAEARDQDLQAQLTQAQTGAKEARAEAQAEKKTTQDLQAELRAAQAPSKLTHSLVELVGAMGATIAYLVFSPEKGKMPPPLQLGIIVASFLALTLINVFVYRCRANSPASQIAPA